ncbi:alkylated DNA repair protein AlkB [Cladophialophora bantiana CBS 173.52]|uniref:mRNA N(6)-methyladenine demethylase n=1 Tax=Cladophialophora bantiana (strain ATCC 10958 / CBS 173.52 / CDC B-1940 / NIH 8579) TaxID=1442370 RepID=A0A0D2GIZ0_CLAB1|nr:alkylated DNA repair protein AlkB [Cladophialophora bantiana CBS 173.52]KIW98352.1 alkylated DNA repair protein AlkB [Cladophialophora bantiana CBS 173.52]
MHNTQARPPEYMRELFKRWRKRPAAEIEADQGIIDPQDPDVNKVSALPESDILRQSDFDIWTKGFLDNATDDATLGLQDITLPARAAFEVNGIPGLRVFPCLLPPRLQVGLLDRLLHRDLSNPAHKTNLNHHHHISYPPKVDDPSPSSFFAAGLDMVIYPKDPAIHKPITSAQMLGSKLRWVTLGGQYDWTNKIYPDGEPPPFPEDIAALLKKIFPTVDAQAAIVNFYSPGDTLSVHRDISEASGNSLISISFGCDAIFLVGNEDSIDAAAIRLRSGDAIVMSGKSRYAWHGVPKILPGTCPAWLQDWPDIAQRGPYQHWRGWMSKKRINLNVRQMTE